MRFILLFLLLILTLHLSAQKSSANPNTIDTVLIADSTTAPVITKHQANINGQVISYTATTGYLPLKDQRGKIKANVFFVAYTKDDGLISHRLSYITGDNDGGIYVITSRGIDRLDSSGHIRHYTASDGLGMGQMIYAFGDRNGNLWFTTTKGLLRYRPRHNSDLPAPTILIDSLRIAGNVHHLSELGENEILGLEMGPNQNQITIDFFALSFGSGESLRYQYKLEGSYSDWSPPGDQRTVNYANLAPGSYRFLVRAIGANGATSEHPAIVAFRVLPPVWRRWWFLALAATLVLSVVFAFARSRIARLRAARESDPRPRR